MRYKLKPPRPNSSSADFTGRLYENNKNNTTIIIQFHKISSRLFRDPSPHEVHRPVADTRRLIGDVRLNLNINPISERSEELIIIDNDVEVPVVQQVVSASKPITVKPLKRLAHRHISESPYKVNR